MDRSHNFGSDLKTQLQHTVYTLYTTEIALLPIFSQQSSGMSCTLMEYCIKLCNYYTPALLKYKLYILCVSTFL